MISVFIYITIPIFIVAYLLYGRFLARYLQLDNARPVPSCEKNDGIDYVPTSRSLLLGQHFSAIAAAGPIVGPILACLWFGWVPAILWIVLGAIFIGGVHDFTALVASIRHKGSSIGEIVKRDLSPASYLFFLIFIWLTLIYVIVAFTDITAQTFKTVLDGEAFGPGVAASSVLYLLLAVIMGVFLYRFKMKVWTATLLFLPLVLLVVWYGPKMPSSILAPLASLSVKQWDMVLLAYCFVASLLPVWLLLQPRGYLGGWFLYLVILIGFVGAIFGGYAIQYPAFNLEGFQSALNKKDVFPLLFITIACGAVSGFHGIVSAGTTSKQLAKEKDALPIGYGAMLLEGVVAVLAMATVIMLAKDSPVLKTDPNLIYAHGIARYLELVHIDFRVALPFALLAFSTFVYDTLDVCTRLARYIFQELTGWRSFTGSIVAAGCSLLLPLAFLLLAKEKGYLVAWPIFGASNQLLASLTLLAVSVWLMKSGKNAIYTLVPMFFMLVFSVWSLARFAIPLVRALPAIFRGESVNTDLCISGVCGIVLLFLSLIFAAESFKVLFRIKRSKIAPASL